MQKMDDGLLFLALPPTTLPHSLSRSLTQPSPTLCPSPSPPACSPSHRLPLSLSHSHTPLVCLSQLRADAQRARQPEDEHDRVFVVGGAKSKWWILFEMGICGLLLASLVLMFTYNIQLVGQATVHLSTG